MTDDEDRTQEIRRDRGGSTSSGSPDTDRFGRRSTGNTPPFGAPGRQAGPQEPQPAQQQQQSSAGYGRPASPPPGYQGGPGYRPAGGPVPAYGAPMVASDRGSGGFPAALVGAVVATLLAVATAYAGYQAARHDVDLDGRSFTGFFVGRLSLAPWPSQGGDYTTAFIAAVVIVLIVTLLLMMAATMGTRAGTGGFAVFLGGWMATVLAGAGAEAAAAAIWVPTGLGNYLSTYVMSGMVWGVLYGWIPALVLLIAHAMRRKPVTR